MLDSDRNIMLSSNSLFIFPCMKFNSFGKNKEFNAKNSIGVFCLFVLFINKRRLNRLFLEFNSILFLKPSVLINL